MAVGLPLTPDRCAAIYDMLRAFPPFKRLPHSDEIKFVVNGRRDVCGEFQSGSPHSILVSHAQHEHLLPVIESIAHEMLHLLQDARGTDTKSQHNAEFWRLSKRLCDMFGWDLKRFVGG